MIDSTRRSPEETFIAERKNQFRLAVGTSNLLDVVSQTIESLLLDKYMYQRIEDWPNDDIKTLISIRTRARELANLSTNGVTKRLETIAHFIGMNLHMEVSNKEKRIQKRKKSEKKIDQSTPTQSSPVVCESNPETQDQPYPELVAVLS